MYPSHKGNDPSGATGHSRDIWPWDTDERLKVEFHNDVTGKSKPNASRRKVIRLDHDKYHETDAHKQKLKNTDKGHGTEYAGEARGITRKPYQTNGDLDLLVQDRQDEQRKTDLLTRQRLREVNTGGSYLDSVSQIASQTSVGDLTDSRALRETEVRFLNTHVPVSSQSSNVKKGVPKLTYVDVQFPGLHNHNIPSSTNHGNSNNMDLPVNIDPLDAPSRSDALDPGHNNRTRRKKRGLTDLPENNDILAKLKEKIRQQQLNASSSDTSSRDESLLEHGTTSREPIHVLHDPYDPVSRRPGANCDGMDKPTMPRKIAVGPPTPNYKGFTDIIFEKNLSRPVKQSAVVKKKTKKPIVNLQPRKYEMYGTEYPVDNALSSSEKAKKPTRVVSHERKSTHIANDIITTSSWRAGQELIRQKLGPPARTKKHSSDSQRKEVVQPEEQRRPDGAEGHDLWLHVGSDNTGTTGNRKNQRRRLSEETQKILDDLHMDASDDDANKNTKVVRSRPAIKRKAAKLNEPDKLAAVAAKQRHYDQEAVRKYIARQKSERLRRKKEEEEQQMNESEKRKRHLEELYTKQKTSTQKPKSKVKHRSQQKSNQIDSNRRRMMSGEYDKENHDTQNNTGHELDDDSSTLTGDTEEETTPVGTPREEKKTVEQKMEGVGKPKFNINVDEVLLRFSEVVKQRKAQAGIITEPSYDQPSLQAFDTDLDLEQRKQAIKEMAGSLRSRLKANSQLNKPADNRGTFQESAPVSQENKEYTSRYDRLVGSTSDVFSSKINLPGTCELEKRAREVLEESYQKEAAIRIQSAYRGHSARQSMITPSVDIQDSKTKPKTHNESKDDESDITVTSTFSEVTATEDSEEDSLNFLPHRDNKSRTRKYNSDKRHPPVGGACYAPPSRYKWEDPKADPFSVMNVLNRRSKLNKESYSLNPVEQQIRDTVTQSVLPADSLSSSRSSLHHHYTTSLPKTNITTSVNIESNLRPQRKSIQSDEDVSVRSSLRSSVREHNEKSEEVRSRQESSSRFRPVHESDAMDTDDSYSNLVEMDRQRSQKCEDHQSVQHVDSDSSVSEKSWSLADKRPTVMSSMDNVRSGPARYSPNSLDRQMMAELNRLESLEESYCQLAGVERTRAVSLAQQESVSLAQVLKSRQMAHDLDMKKLQFQVQQEAYASDQQLNDIKLRTQGQTYSKSPYSQQSSFPLEPPMHSTPAPKVTENLKKRPEVSASHSLIETGSKRSVRTKTDTDGISDSISRKSRDLSKVSTTGSSYTSRHSKPSRSGSGSISVVTAKDSLVDTDSGSSIKSASDADAQDISKAESIAEEIQDGDYTMSFDESITEDESFRQVLPSESHRKEVKRRQSDDSFLQQDEGGTSQLSIGDMSSLFVGGDTLGKFTADMVRQLMKEEELRAQHQAAMLRIRETALKKKADAELSWLRQQKQHLRDKGADDVHPQFKKKEKIVLKELHEKQAEIHRLQEANLQASRERQLVLKQQEVIAKLHQKKRMAKLQDGLIKLTGRLGRPADIHTEDEASGLEEVSDVNDDYSMKEYKSDSEVYADKINNKTSMSDKRKFEKQQKLWLNDKYLTKREHKLLSRKKNAEELLAWKKHLDDEEAKVFQLEKEALVVWDHKENAENTNKKTVNNTKQETGKTEKASKPQAPPIRKESESIVSSDQIITASDDSYTPTSQLSTPQTETKDRPKPQRSEVKPQPPKGSGSDVSIPEEVPSNTNQSSVTPDKHNKIHDSSDDTIVNSSVNEEYTTETFEADTSASRRRKPLGRYLPSGSPLPSPWSRKTGSESESEDSISHTDTVSDTSDYEGRIRHLNDELRRRRKEFDILKKERKQRKKEKLKAQEESLKKQVEAYDNYINQLKHDQSDLELETQKSVVKPLIKHPSKTKGGHVNKEETTIKRQRDQEGSFSSSYEDTLNGSDSAQTSPNLSDRDIKLSPLVDKKKLLFLDRISEGSESANSLSEKVLAAKSSRKADGKEPHSQSSASELIEELSHVSDVSDKSGLLKLDIGRAMALKGDEVDQTKIEDDPTYSMDFTASASSLHTNLKPSLSARSDKSVSRLLSDRDESNISEQIDEAISVQSESSRCLKLDLNEKRDDLDNSGAGKEKSVSQAVTGIQESDSENDSHTKSHHTLSNSPTVSRPSSGTERSVASSYGVNFEDEESERTLESESESEKTPIHVAAQVHSGSKINSQMSEEDISEHISVSLPSLSDKVPSHYADTTNHALNQILGEITNDDMTPREATPFIGDDETNSLLLTDPLSEFQLQEPVLVWGRKKGKILYKGKVDFAPGIWAGVELEDSEENQDDICHRYFECRPGHGVLVPGSDIRAISDEMKFVMETKQSTDDSLTSQEDASASTDSDLEKAIKNAAQNVQQFKEKEQEILDKNALADKLTNEIAAEMIVESVETMGRLSDKQTMQQKKIPPPTLPKPKNKQPPVSDIISSMPKSPKSETATDSVMNTLLENAISQMINIRNKKQGNAEQRNTNEQSPLVNGHLGSESDTSDIGFETDVIKDEFQRPLTPALGGSRIQDVEQLDKDLSDLLGCDEDDDDEYFEETLGVASNKPILGTEKIGIIRAIQPEVKEVLYAIPHKKSEVEPIINEAIDIFWNLRRCGEPFTNVKPPESFFQTNEENLSMEKKSEKTFKSLLFDLTGEIICDIYSQEEEIILQPWEKPKRQRHRYFKGCSPPTTVDNLRPVIQIAISDILGLNGTRKTDRVKNKFSLRKKKDHIDNILAQELREEVPDWLDYNSDELNVKMALTDSIFEMLLTETVETCTKIYNKKLHRQDKMSQ